MNRELPLLPLVLARVPEALTAALETEGAPYVRQADDPRGGRFVLHDTRLAPMPALAEGQQPIDLRSVLGDLRIERLDDQRTALCQWQVGPLSVCEWVSRIDKAALRREALARLRAALQAAGGVWLRVGAYPLAYRTAFCLRLDHDARVDDDLRRVMHALRGVEHATTHFVCASSHVGQADAIRALQGLDIGSHGYWHHSYRRADEQRRNLERGIDALRAAGLQPRGFAAPHGRYTPGLGAMLDELGVGYSSEFGLLHDDLPRRAPGARAWQVPVHPVCLGIVLEAARREAARERTFVDGAACAAWMSDYFARAAVAKHAAGEPLFFYGHPDGRLGRYPEVITHLLQAVRELPDVWWTSLSRWTEWWQARRAARIQAWRSEESGRLEVSCVAPGRAPALPLALEHVAAEGVAQWRFEPGAQTVNLVDAPRWRPDEPWPRGARVQGSDNVRERFKRWIDYERETPRAEIERRDWRGSLKFAIRSWREAAAHPVRAARRSAPDRPLRVRLVGSLTASLAPGGGERQMAALIDALQAEGVEAAAWRPWEDAWDAFDLLHLVGSCPEHLPLAALARQAGKPIVLSPVAWFDGAAYWRSDRPLWRRVASRSLLTARRFAPWTPGWRRRLYRSVDRLLPNSRGEADQLVKLFGVDPARIAIVPNGADPGFQQAEAQPFVERFGLRDFVLCAGRVEPRKNQLGLIAALAELNVTTVVLGDVVPGHEAYADRCRRAGGARTRFLPRLAPDSPLLGSAYAACGCLAQPSWFETPGLAALEAAMTGAPLAVTRVGGAPEYFGRWAHYVDPHDSRSIRRGVVAALEEGRTSRLAEHVRSRFTWQHVARATREVYAPLV